MNKKKMIKVLHLLTGGGIGGIETLCREISKTDRFENGFVFLSFGGNIYDEMKANGAKVYPLFQLGGKFSLKKASKLIRIAKEYDVLIVHHEDPFLEWYFCNTIRKTSIKGIRYVHSCYADDFLQYKNPIKNHINHSIIQKSLNIADRVIYVSEAGKNSCHTMYHIKPDKERIIYNGISETILKEGESYLSKERATWANKSKHILFTGRLVSIKGVDLLVSACAEIMKTHDVHLTLVGDGDERGKIEKQVEDLGISEKVCFAGFQTDIGGYLRDADIFIYPSTVQEVFGLSVVEAMAFGLLCIATPVGGIPEIIQDGVNGFLTESCTIQGIQKSIERGIGAPEYQISRMAKEARRTAEQYSIERCLWNLHLELQEIKANKNERMR